MLATSPARLWALDDLPPTAPPVEGGLGDMVMGVYTRGGTVFTSGCTDWACGLEGRDPVIVRITRNLVERLGSA